MTRRLERLEAALDAAYNAYHTANPCAAADDAWDAYNDAWNVYYAELKGIKRG